MPQEPPYSIEELAMEVNAWCDEHDISPASGQAGESVTERNIRYYRTLGLVDAPGGGGAGFGEKHFLQLVAIRILQAQGLPLSRIRELLFGRSLSELREVQRRGLSEKEKQSPHLQLQPGADEIWRAIPLDADFLLISRKGVPLSKEQHSQILSILHDSPGHQQPAGAQSESKRRKATT